MTRARWAALLMVLALAALAVQGGEYSTANWLLLQREVVAERAQVAALEQSIAGLKRRAKAVESDPAEQERLARERWGYIRPGETLYRIVRPGEN